MKCQNDLSECICPDIEERMASLKGSSYVVMRWCSVCDKHYALCKCENPVWTTNDKMKREN